MSVITPGWLDLRESADAAARSAELADVLAGYLEGGPLVVHDLGGGSGSMGRWLSPRLPGPQHWIVHDRDPHLLALAVAAPPGPAATVEGRRSDITRLIPDDLAGASLVTASALLDILTAGELQRMLRACAGHPLLLALTVVGHVTLSPADPLDARIEAAFNAHQRREGRLGPGAVAAAVRELGDCIVRPSPWRLDSTRADLIAEWLEGWLGAACEQEPALAPEADAYRERRLAQDLAVTVDHADLLVLP